MPPITIAPQSPARWLVWQFLWQKAHRVIPLPIRDPIIIAAPIHFSRHSTFSNISTICNATDKSSALPPAAAAGQALAPRTSALPA
ncbi:MAG: hypothetical protein WBQ55_01055 [Xanthobacteraceae bacterium]